MVTDDLSLLREFEPVVRFTRGEYFYPVAVDRYVAASSLWADHDDEPVQVCAPGSLSSDSLSRHAGPADGVGRALSGIGLGGKHAGRPHIPSSDRPPRLRGSNRLATVGIAGRLVDSFNRVSLLFRGSVPGGSAARSFLLQRDHLKPDEPTYYGRVVRDGPWIICQYWYFYSFNNWRSAFGGVNEHEADWEQVTIYLDAADDAAPPQPRWVAYSAHDETGDDLRRRWDDPDLTLVDGRHPVVFAGAGSHSGAYLAGDYLITVQPPSFGGLVAFIRWLARVFVPWSVDAQESLGIPYVDYARGDGRSIGASQADPWVGVLINDSTTWVRDYRGLWGHDTGDRLGGERGPAGPRYERDGTVRESWADPIGWAGLAKVAPNQAVEQALMQRRSEQIDVRLRELDEAVAAGRDELACLAAGMAPSAPEVRALAQDERSLLKLRMEQVRLVDEQHQMSGRGTDAFVPPHAHLRHRRTPLQPVAGVRARFLSWWAVISTPLVLLALGAIVFPNNQVSATATAIVWILLLLSIEGLVRGKLLAVLVRLVLVVAAGSLLAVLWNDWRYVLGVLFTGAALLSLVVNVRESIRR